MVQLHLGASLSGGNSLRKELMSGRFMLLLFNDLELIDSLFYGKNCFVKCPLLRVCLVLLLSCIFDAKDG